MTELPKQYQHAETEKRWYRFWEDGGYFHSEPDPQRKPYTIVIPPPNVTGALHLGHALNNTLQDILIRFKRMQGFNALWMPGTDHAGIATQAVVERRLLQEEKKTRHDLGREKLVERIWQWKDEYEKRILGQLKQMGCSCDWQRTRFTLDDVCARAVRHTFFKLFQERLIYRGKRLVNWDTYLQTAVSDDEVFHEEVKGHFWHFRYPVIDPQPGEPSHVTIATTRPETMLGDTAVAVHPDPAAALDQVEAELRQKLAAANDKERPEIQAQLDALAERRQTMLPTLVKLRDMALAGRKLMLPLLNREIPLVADAWAKPELGSGCVKITPAHDPNDYDVGKRAEPADDQYPQPRRHAERNAGCYEGLPIPKARERVVADMEAAGLLVEVEDREIDLAHSDRSKTPIEPYLADQWFVKMDQLGPVGDGRRERRPREDLPLALYARVISTGSAKSAIGPSAGNCGGATKSRSGTRRDRQRGRSRTKAFAGRRATSSGSETNEHGSSGSICALQEARVCAEDADPRPSNARFARQTCSTPGSVLPSGRIPRSAGRSRRRS